MPIRALTLDDVPTELIDRFDAGDGLLWTGAGVSRRSIESRDHQQVRVGVPSGSEMQRHLHKWTRGPYPDPETLAELAGLYQLQRGRDSLNRLLRVAYGADGVIAPAFYGIVAALPPAVRVFVTTNYDPFLERALRYRDPVVVVRDGGLERVTQTRPVVYKPHGDAQQPDGCVITTADYDAWESSTGSLPAQLAALYLQHTVVAIGYRAQDDNFRRLLRMVNVNIVHGGGTPHTMYVVIPDAEINTFAAYAGNEYDIVLVRATGEQFLRWLIGRLEERRRAREADALSRLIDPPRVRTAQRNAWTLHPPVDPALPPAADVADLRWLPYAEALERLGDEQLEAKHSSDGLWSLAKASRAYRLAGESAKADVLYRRVLEETVERRHDAELTDRLLRSMRMRDRGLGDLPSPNDDDTRMLAALAETWQGIPGQAIPFIAALEAQLLKGPASDELDAVNYRLERLRAELAVTNEDFARAAEAFGRAAMWAPSNEQQASCTIRSAFFAGFQPDTSVAAAALGRLRALPVHNVVEPLRQRAIGWLASLSGLLDEAGNAFDRAAALAVERLDPVAAATAFRASAWVDRQRPTLVISAEDGPGVTAYRLEQTAASPWLAPRATVSGILREAQDTLYGKRWAEAWRAASRARRLAFEDLDPDGVDRADSMLAETWLASVANTNDDYSLFWAAHFAGHARAGISEDSAAAWSAPLRTALSREESASIRTVVVRHLARDPISRRARAGFLLLLADIAELIDAQELTGDVVPAIIAGLQSGWGPNPATDPASAACRAVQATYERLSPSDAERIAAAITSMSGATPFIRLGDRYLALAQAVAMAPTPQDGGASRAGDLLGALDNLRRAPHLPSYLEALHMALAATAERADSSTRSRVIAALEGEASLGDWSGIAILAARGIPIPDTVADRYLQAMTARVRALTVDVSPNSFGPVNGDFASLTQYAAEHASSETRDQAITTTIALLEHDGQWGACRAQWVYFLVRLLPGTPDWLADASSCLLRLAQGQFSEPGDLRRLTSNHPFSGVRIDLGPGSNLRVRALAGLGALWGSLSVAVREKVREVLLSAVGDRDPAVREGALVGVGQAARISHEDWQQRALVQALRDPNERIRDLALGELT